jgi:hypothetical protein
LVFAAVLFYKKLCNDCSACKTQLNPFFVSPNPDST